ncbi:MAG TPA: glutamate-5-semialdehyde dehydrogenase [Patescibacteria group bacterium]|nr:glutamate-5-semialdehyde dehydrogenase [Patescibacteria group bacterium]
MTSSNPLESLGADARKAAGLLARADTSAKNAALSAIADGIRAAQKDILKANDKDVAAASNGGMAEAQIDRLKLDEKRLAAVIESVDVIKSLPDPVGRILETITRPNGLKIEKHAVPIGVIGIIFESRPNVAVDAAALCLKSGNACILRGGRDSWQSVKIFVEIIQKALEKAGLPRAAVQTLPSADRDLVGALLRLDTYVDVIVPRGGKSLIARVREESRVPVFGHLDGICHTYIDAKADPSKAVAVTLNAKMRRTSICGATECLLLHKDIVNSIGKDSIAALLKAGCEVRAPKQIAAFDPAIKQAKESDYGFEFLAPIIAVAVVEDVKDAVAFINRHGSQHTDAIITEDSKIADYFLRHVDSAIALHNASTQFADGGEFGKGAEIGIATGKLHARGPVGLEELTTYQYRVHGNGQTRP